VAASLDYTNVYRAPYGFPTWQDAGLPVTSYQADHTPLTHEPIGPGPLHGWALLLTLATIFLGGMALNLTPCVYPLVPITVSYFGGRDEQENESLLGHGMLYIVGLALTNSILGVVAALTGGMLGALLQSPTVLISVAGLLTVFATSLFGLWELRLPSGLTRIASKNHAGYFGTFFMGLTLGVVAAPCLGPFVLGLLTWVASMGSPWIGFLIFFTLSLGLGLPLFALAVFSGKIVNLPKSGEWMLWVRKVMGWALIGMAAHFIRPLLPESIEVTLLASVALCAGIHLGWIDKAKSSFKVFSFVKTAIGTGAIILAIILMGTWIIQGPSVAWHTYSAELLTQAKAEGKPVILDFSATWCTPCRELDEITFRDPTIVQRSAQDFIMIKIDLTIAGNAPNEQLVRDYGVRGVPTIVFIDAQGKERDDLRLVDFLAPDEFLKRMDDLN